MNAHYFEFTSSNGKRHLVNRANVFAINEEEALTGTGDTKVYVVTSNGQATLAKESYEELAARLTGSLGETVLSSFKISCDRCDELRTKQHQSKDHYTLCRACYEQFRNHLC